MEELSRVGDCFYRLSSYGCRVFAYVYKAEVSFPTGVDYPCVTHTSLGYFVYPDIYAGETLIYLIHKQFKEVLNGSSPKNFVSSEKAWQKII